MLKAFVSFIFLVFAIGISAQDHFLVELENRSPDVKDMVKSYEGFPMVPFLANDSEGNEHSSFSMQGKTTFLWFWNQDCPKCIEYIDALNRVASENKSTLNVISFSDNSKEQVVAFKQNTDIQFPVIPNSKTLADGPYGGDFGYPRLFIIDEFGAVKYVIPEMEMRGNFDAYGFFSAVERSLRSK